MFDGFWWDWNQHRRINDAADRINETRHTISAVERDLRDRLDYLMLINVAMHSFLDEKLGVTQQDLADRVREIDLRDGKLDGKLATEAQECPRCKRVMSVKHQK